MLTTLGSGLVLFRVSEHGPGLPPTPQRGRGLPSTLGRRIIRKPTSNLPVRRGNRLITCSDEIERDGTAVLGENRQSPAIAPKTRAHREFNAPVFHGATFHRPPPL
jgi:hypothetical protein